MRSWIKRNALQSKVETPPQGWRRAGDAIAGGGKLEKVVSTDYDVNFYK